jgi:Ca2+-binding RTX toxin-like protein
VVATPDQAQRATVDWRQAEIELGGFVTAGEAWTLVVDGTSYTVLADAQDAVPARIARRLAALLPGDYLTEVRTDVLGETRLLVRRANGATLRADVTITPAAGANRHARPVDDPRRPRRSRGRSRAGRGRWSPCGCERPARPAASGASPSTASPRRSRSGPETGSPRSRPGLARALRMNPADLTPLVSGTRIVLRLGEDDEVPAAGVQYVVAPLNLNLRVDEAGQVDVLKVNDGDSRTDGTLVVTSDRLTGLGMGDDVVLGSRVFAGGITYRNLEDLQIQLGDGKQDVVVRSTHLGRTTILGGAGDDRVLVETAQGHVLVRGENGDDELVARGPNGRVEELTALLAFDGGAGEDRFAVDDRADTTGDPVTVTPTTITGLDLARMPEVQTITVRAGAGTFVLGLQGATAGVTLGYDASEALLASAVAALLGVPDVRVVVRRTILGELVRDVTWTITMTGELAGRDLPQLVVLDASRLVPNVDSTVRTTWATIADGTSTPERSTVQALTVPATGGTYALEVLLPTAGGIRRLTTTPIAFNAGAEAVQAALSAILNPNNADPSRPYTDNVRVVALGTELLVFFQGTAAGARIGYVTSALQGTARLADRTRGVLSYAGVETLDLFLGSGDDQLDVLGTSATTNVALGAGDDRIHVSSAAGLPFGARPDLLRGTLDDIRGVLNLDVGSGRHRLLISDQDTMVGDQGFLTSRIDNARAAAPAVASDAELFLVGLAPAAITWRAASDGHFADGISIWMGGGRDVFAIDGTHLREGWRTLTTLSAGLGDDELTVALTRGRDDVLVVDAQGPVRHVLPLGRDLRPGTHWAPADTVLVTIDGVAVAPEFVQIDLERDEVSLLIDVPDGAVVAIRPVRTTVHALTAGPVRTAPLALGFDLAEGADVAVAVNGVVLDPGSVFADAATDRLTFAPGTEPAEGALVLVTVTLVERAQTFVGPATLPLQDDDIVRGESSSVPLVLIGGAGNDILHGGTGSDVILGDRGLVLWLDPAALPTDANAPNLPLAELIAAAGTVVGNGGPGDRTDGIARPAAIVLTRDHEISGDDLLTSGSGADIVLGGPGDDTIDSGQGEVPGELAGDDVVLGDTGEVDRITLDGDAGSLDRARTTDTGLGGRDTISTGAGHDVVLAGPQGDEVDGGNGDDLILGDSGSVVASGPLQPGLPAWAARGLVVTSTAPGTDGQGGDDVLRGGGGDDWILGQQGADRIDGGDGNDDLVGGSEASGALDGDDVIDGGLGDDVLAGDNAIVTRRAGTASAWTRAPAAAALYDADLRAQVGATPLASPLGSPARDVTLLDHTAALQSAGAPVFGDDALAGGGGDDLVLGGLGDDVLQGDGTTAPREGGKTVGAARTADGDLVVVSPAAAATDGDDRVEGGGGADVLFGGGGQDDLIGGSSSLFGLTSAAQRPDGRDLIFGGDGTRIGRDDAGDSGPDAHTRDADVLVGDNADVWRLARGTAGAPAYLTFNYDASPTRRLVPRAVVLLDNVAGGPDLRPDLFPGGVLGPDGCGAFPGGGDELHGEAGDDAVHGGCGDDVLFGDGQDDDLVGGWGNDWLSGGTGDDALLGDEGLIRTQRVTSSFGEPLYGLAAIAPDEIDRPGLERRRRRHDAAVPGRVQAPGGRPRPLQPAARRRRGRRAALRRAPQRRPALRRPGRRRPPRRGRRRRPVRCRGARGGLPHPPRRPGEPGRHRPQRLRPAGEPGQRPARGGARRGPAAREPRRPLRARRPAQRARAGRAAARRAPGARDRGRAVGPVDRRDRRRRQRRPVRRRGQRLARRRHRPRPPVGRLR